jgi:AcrR family transcriptional regulator
VSRSLKAARSRAEQRVQRFLDAAFELIDEKGTVDFTIQEVIDRSKQSLRGFYQYFDSKDELLLALFEETVRESADDLRHVVDAETDPLERLRAFTIRLHEWCDPADGPRKRGSHNRRPISEFSVQLAATHPDRVKTALAPVSHLLLERGRGPDAEHRVRAAPGQLLPARRDHRHVHGYGLLGQPGDLPVHRHRGGQAARALNLPARCRRNMQPRGAGATITMGTVGPPAHRESEGRRR